MSKIISVILVILIVLITISCSIQPYVENTEKPKEVKVDGNETDVDVIIETKAPLLKLVFYYI